MTDLLANEPMVFARRRVTILGMFFHRINLVLQISCGQKTCEIAFGRMLHELCGYFGMERRCIHNQKALSSVKGVLHTSLGDLLY